MRGGRVGQEGLTPEASNVQSDQACVATIRPRYSLHPTTPNASASTSRIPYAVPPTTSGSGASRTRRSISDAFMAQLPRVGHKETLVWKRGKGRKKEEGTRGIVRMGKGSEGYFAGWLGLWVPEMVPGTMCMRRSTGVLRWDIRLPAGGGPPGGAGGSDLLGSPVDMPVACGGKPKIASPRCFPSDLPLPPLSTCNSFYGNTFALLHERRILWQGGGSLCSGLLGTQNKWDIRLGAQGSRVRGVGRDPSASVSHTSRMLRGSRDASLVLVVRLAS